MKSMKRLCMTVASVAAILATAACGNGGGASEPSADERTPEKGGSMTVYLSSLPATLLASEKASEDVTFPIYGNLIRFGEDETPYGVLAEGIESKDPSTWVLRLRDDVDFTDGTPLDAEAVKYNWEWHADEANQSQGAANAAQIKSMTAVDPQTLEIKLASPNVEFFMDIATGPLNAIGSPTAMKTDIKEFAKKPVGAGPFVVSEWAADDHLTLERNPDYVDPEKPYLDELKIMPVADFEQELNVMSSGESALANAASGSEQEEYRNLGLTVESANSNGGTQYLFNTRKPPFDDARIRQAVIQAIDLDELNDAVYDGAEEVATTPFRDSSPFYREDVNQRAYDKAAAQKLIDEYVAEKGPVKFDILTSNASTLALEAEWIGEKLNELDGLDVGIRAIDTNSYVEGTTTGNFAMAYYGTTFMGSGGNYRGRLTTDAPQNYTGYSNDEVDELLALAASEADIDKRTDLIAQVQQITNDEAPMFWTFAIAQGWAIAGDGGGLKAWGKNYYEPESLFVLPAK